MLFGLESGAGLYEVAITVNYLCENGSLDWQTAMRLDQSFYERVHLLVETGNAGQNLRRMLTMGYGGNVLIEGGQQQKLLIEIDELEVILRSIPQLDELREAVKVAIGQKKSIVFFGDMYPELDKPLRHKLSRPEFIQCKRCGHQHKSPFWDVCLGCGHVRVDSVVT